MIKLSKYVNRQPLSSSCKRHWKKFNQKETSERQRESVQENGGKQ